jgi:hypothetical protein
MRLERRRQTDWQIACRALPFERLVEIPHRCSWISMRRFRLTMDEQIAAIAVAAKGSYEAAGKYLGGTKSAIRKRSNGWEVGDQ